MDVLAALENLEDAEREKKYKGRTQPTKKGKGSKSVDVAAQNAAKNEKAGRSVQRSRSQGSSRSAGVNPSRPASQASGRARSRAQEAVDTYNSHSRQGAQSPAPSRDSRRISFSEPSRPEGTKLWVSTKTESLASGFEYDVRLQKFGVGEEEWKDFTTELVSAAAIPGPSFMWPFRKSKIIARIKKDLQYNGDISAVFKKWNRVFKIQRFQAWLELPGEKSQLLPGNDESEFVDVKKFRVVVTPNKERAPSVYSRSNSLTRSISGEGQKAVEGRSQVESEGEAPET